MTVEQMYDLFCTFLRGVCKRAIFILYA